jgi:hypothetical protein
VLPVLHVIEEGRRQSIHFSRLKFTSGCVQ